MIKKQLERSKESLNNHSSFRSKGNPEESASSIMSSNSSSDDADQDKKKLRKN